MVTSITDRNPSRLEMILFLSGIVPGILMFWFFDLPEAVDLNPAFKTQRAILFSVVIITIALAIVDFFGTSHHPSVRSVTRPITALVYGLDIGGGFVFAFVLLRGLGFP